MFLKNYQEKISYRQGLIIYLTALFSLSGRISPQYSAMISGRSGILAPIVSLIFLVVVLFFVRRIYRDINTKDISFAKILENFVGKFVGKFITLIYLVFLIILLGIIVNYYSDRLVSTMFNNIDFRVFSVCILILVSYAISKGLETIARVSEIILGFILLGFLVFSLSLIPEIKVENILPIRVSDSFSIIKSSIYTTSIWLLIIPLFFISDKFKDIKDIQKHGYKFIYFITIGTLILNFVCIGSLGTEIIKRVPYSVLSTAKQVQLFDAFEKIESFVIVLFIASDFILIMFLSYIILNMMKSVFELKRIGYIKNLFLFLIYIISLSIGVSRFDVDIIFERYVNIINIILAAGIPFMVYIISLVRRKSY